MIKKLKEIKNDENLKDNPDINNLYEYHKTTSIGSFQVFARLS